MKMRLLGRGISNRYCDILLNVEGRFERSRVLRAARDAAEEMDYYGKYFSRASRERQPYVYIKTANEFGGTNYAHITASDTLLHNTKKITIKNHGFDKKDLEFFTNLILSNLKVLRESPPFHHESQHSSRPGKQACDSVPLTARIPQQFQQSLEL